MNKIEKFAVGQYLSSIPEDKTYDQILDMVAAKDDHEEIVVWQPFENDPGPAVARLIADLKFSTEMLVKSIAVEGV